MTSKKVVKKKVKKVVKKKTVNKGIAPIVNASWEALPPEYALQFKCPNKQCGCWLDESMILEYMDVAECESVNRVVTCAFCNTKFRLKAGAFKWK